MPRRRIWSVLAAVLLCLVMLPATAWAEYVAPNKLLVGSTNVVAGGYWTTNDDGSLTAADSSNYNVHYDGNGNLWLKDANIAGQGQGFEGATGIYAYYDEWVDTDIALTIHLDGDNSVSNGYPIYVGPWGGSASLTITGAGSLTATGTFGGNGGIFVKGDTSSLTIEDGANVMVNCERSSAVTIIADALGKGTLKVDDATLQAYGFVIDEPGNPYGICFSYSGSKDEIVDGSRVLTVSGDSIVRTNYMQATYTDLVIMPSTQDGGIVFDGSDGTVYGDMTLQEDLSIGKDENLIISNGASLTIPEDVSLINEGTVTGAGGSIVNNGTIYNSGALPEGISGSGSQIEIPTYTLNCPEEIVLKNDGGGKYQAQFGLSLEDDPILGEGGKVVVYGSYREADMVLRNEEDARQTIPFTIGAHKNNGEGSYLKTDNQVKVLAVLDGASDDSYSVEVLCEQSRCAEVANGTYSGAFDLYVGYTEDDDVQFGDDVSGVDLDKLDRHTVTVTFENEDGFAFTVQPKGVAVTEGETASFSADWTRPVDQAIWQQRADEESAWEDTGVHDRANYSVANMTVDMDGYQFRLLVCLPNGVWIPSDVATLTVHAKTAITTQPVDANVIEGDAATFTVEATGSGDLSYQWQQSADGTAWTDIPGATSASYTVPAATMEMDGYQYRCVVIGDGGEAASNAATLSVTAAVFKISASPEALDFGSVYVGYEVPVAQTVTVANEGNKNVTLVQPSSAEFEIGALSATELAPGDTATFTVQPKEGLGVGAHNEDLAIAASDGAAACVELSFTVRSRPYIPPVSSGPDWDDVVDDISSAKPGDRVSVDMDGETVLPAEVIEALAGRDVTLVLEMEDEVAWEITGTDVPADASYEDVDMGVSLGGDAIPVDVVNLVTGEFGTVQVMLEHDGPFGFKATLVAPMGKDVAGMYANLYRYDDDAEALDFEVSGVVDEDGAVRLAIDHASSWLIVLDARSHALPFADADEDLWYSEAVRWTWLHGIMTGYADGSGRFGTDDSLTRAQMAAVLYNVAGKPDVDVSGLPGDCDGDAWYASCVSWALETGVFNGYGDGSAFGPDDPLTREQAACVLMNAASVLGADVSARADLSAFPDADEVSSWASDALSWAVAEGVLSGVETADGARELQPTRACTRAEMAALMMNLSARAAE